MALHSRTKARSASKNRRRRARRPAAITAPLRYTPLALERLEDRALLATIVWDGEGGDNAWGNAANWFNETSGENNVLPTSADDVEIRTPFAGQVISLVSGALGTTATINSLRSAAGLHIQGGSHAPTSLRIAATAEIDGPVSLVSGEFGGGTITINDRLTWTGGSLAGGGTLIVSPSATLALDSVSGPFSSGSWTIENRGTFDWMRGNLHNSDPMTINNRPEALFNVRNGGSLGSGNSGRILNNEGTVRKSEGTGRAEIAMIFNNSGSVQVAAGTLAIVKGGVSSGDFSFAAGTTLELRGGDDFFNNSHTITLGPTDSIEGLGRLLIADRPITIQGTGVVDIASLEISTRNGARLNWNLDAVVPSVLLSQGALGGTGTLTVTEMMNWTGGEMGDGGTTRIAAGARLTIDAAGVGMAAGGRTIENFGNVEWARGNINASGSARLTINNRAGGLLDIRSSGTAGNTGSVLNNSGTVRKSAGTGRSEFAMVLNSTSLVEVQTGTLAFTRGGISSGNFLFDAGTTLELIASQPGFTTTTHTITLGPADRLEGEGRLLIGTEKIIIQGSGLVAPGILEVGGSFAGLELNANATVPKVILASGVLGGTGTLTITDSMSWTGGSMAGSGTMVVGLGATLTIQGNGVSINDNNSGTTPTRTIDNFGTIQWLGGNIFISDPLVIRNRAGALFDIRTDATLVPQGSLINEGTLRKTAGTGTTIIDMAVSNAGTVEVHSGALRFAKAVTNWNTFESALVGGTWLVSTADPLVSTATLRLDGVSPFENNSAHIILDGASANLINQSGANLLGSLRRIDSGSSLTLSGGRTLAPTAGGFQNVGALAIGAGSTLAVSGDFAQSAGAHLNVTLGGEPASGLFGRVTATGAAHLDGTLRIVVGDGFVPTPGPSYEVMTFASKTGAFAAYDGLFVEGVRVFDVAEAPDRVLIQATTSDIEWDLSPLAIVRAGAVQFLAAPGPGGEVAQLHDLEITLLPHLEDGPLATFTIDQGFGFDEDGGPLSVDSFLIESASAFFDELLLGPADAPLLAIDDLTFFIAALSNRGGVLSGGINVSAALAELFPAADEGQFAASAEDLVGQIDISVSEPSLELSAQQSELQIGQAINLAGEDLQLFWPPQPSGAIAELAAATLSFPAYPRLPSTEISGLTISRDGFELDDFVVSTSASGYGVADIVEFDGLLSIEGTGISVQYDEENSLSLAGQLSLEVERAALLPNGETTEWGGLVTADGLQGEINLAATLADGTIDLVPRLTLAADEAALTIPDLVTISASPQTVGDDTVPGLSLSIDPTSDDPAAPIASLHNLRFAFPALPGIPPELLTIDSITVRRNGADIDAVLGGPATNVDIGADPVLLTVSDLTIDVDLSVSFVPPEGSSVPAVLVDGTIDIAASAATLLPGSGVAGAITDGDPLDDQPALAGAIDRETGRYQVAVDRLTAEVDGLVGLEVEDGMLLLAPNLSDDEPFFTAASATLTLPWLDEGDISLTAANVVIATDGDASITSAELLTGSGLATSFGLAGLLPFDITRIAIAGLDENEDGQPEPISLRNFESDVTVQGFFDFTAFESVGFRPTVTIDGVERPEGSDNPFAITFRLVDEQVVPWNTGPITLGLDAAEVFEGFSLDGSLTLGGYVSGDWIPDIDGSLTAELVVSDETHGELTVNILPGSTLDIASGLLNITGEVLLDAGIGGTFGGATLDGGRLPFHLLLEVDRTDEPPYFTVQQPVVTFGALSINELTIDVGGVFILTASQIEIDMSAPPGDPIATIGQLEIDVPGLPGLSAQALVGAGESDIPGVLLYRDRLELDEIVFTLGGTLNLDGTDLLALDDLFFRFDSVAIPFEGITDLLAAPTSSITLTDLAPLLDPSDPLAQIEGISFGFDAAVLLPDEGAAIPDVECGDSEALLAALESETAGVAVVACAAGSIDAQGTLRLLVGAMAARVADLFEVTAADAQLVIPGPSAAVTDPLFTVAESSLAIALFDDQQLELTATGLTIGQSGAVSILTAGAAPVSPATTIGQTLGLADIVPLDVTSVLIDGGGTPISLDNPQFDFTVAGLLNLGLFAGLPFEPFIQIGDGDAATVLDDPTNVFVLTLNVDATPPPGQPPVTITNAGPFYLGFKEFALGDMTIDGLIALGEVIDSRFSGDLGGIVRLRWGDINVDPNALDIELAVLGQITTEQLDADTVVTTFNADFTGTGSGNIGGVLSVEEASFEINMAFQNTARPGQPFDFAPVPRPGEVEPYPVFRLDSLDTGDVTLEFGDFVTLVGRAEVNVTAGPNEPLFILREATVELDEALGPLADLSLSGGGFGIGADGRIYVLADDPATPEDEGAFIELGIPAGASSFGLPDWVPLTINRVALRFNGIDADGDGQPDDLDGDGQPDAYDISLGGGFSQFAPLINPENFTLLISGGLTGVPDFWPIEAQVERLAIDLGILADNVLAAAEHFNVVDDQGNIQLDQVKPWQIFAVPPQPGLEFPITNIDAVNFGIEPIDFGAFQAGAGLGFGVLNVERDDGGEERVFFARVEGQLGVGKIGLGAELIVTQYGPVLGRIFAGVPIPIGTLIGSLGGPIGGGIGTATGFLIVGLQGGIVFGGDPLPVIENATDIFTTPEIRFPLSLDLEAVRAAVTPLVNDNPTFSEIVAGLSNLGVDDFTLENLVTAYVSGDLPGLDFHFTWEDGFRLAASGVLTNQYVTGMIGAAVTLGANFGYDADELFDVQGNPLSPDAIGFQLFGIADLEVFGQKLVGAGLLMDYADILNPVFHVAASLPGAPGSLLSLLLPAQGNLGLTIDYHGLNEGSLVAAIAFVERIAQSVSGATGALFGEVLGRLAAELEASRRTALGLPLDGLSLAADFVPDPADPLWQILLDVNGDQVVAADEQREITANFLIARLIGGGSATPPVPALLPTAAALDFGNLTGQIDPLAELHFATFDPSRLTDLLLIGYRLIGDASRIGMDVISDPGALDLGGLDDELPLLPSAVSLIDATFDRLIAGQPAHVALALNEARGRAINSSRVSMALAKLVLESGRDAIDKFFETIDPELRITGRLQPMILGIPLGEPKEEVSVTINKHLLSIQARVGVIEKLVALSGIPLPIGSEEFVDIHFPFENILLDLANARLPALDPLGGDWRVGLGSSLNIVGLEIGQATGYLFPPDAHELLIDGRIDRDSGVIIDPPILQIYDPADPNPERLDPTRILVHEQFVDRLLDEGGILADGRLTLPRFITDPLALFAELEQLGLQLCGDSESILDCILADPLGALNFLISLTEQLSAVEEVAQLQLFVPNFIDDVIAKIDPELLAPLLDPQLAASSDPLIDTILAHVVQQATLVGQVVADNFYLRGSYGQLPQPYSKEAFASVEFPTTSKLLGIDIGGAQVTGDTQHFEIIADFLGVAAMRFLIDANPAFADNALPRVGAEIAFGSGAGSTHPQAQLVSMLSALGFDPEALTWLGLPREDLVSGSLRAFSPGYELPSAGEPADSVEQIKQTGGIEAEARLVVPGFVDNLQTSFSITPSGTIVPDVTAQAQIENLTIPGLAGLPIELFSVDLALSFSNEGFFTDQTVIQAAVSGSVHLAGQEQAAAGQVVLDETLGAYGFVQLGQSGGLFDLGLFDFAGTATLLVNATNQTRTFDLPGLGPADDPELAPRTGSLLLDGTVTIAGVTIDGLFQLSRSPSGLLVIGVGTMDAFGFDLDGAFRFITTAQGEVGLEVAATLDFLGNTLNVDAVADFDPSEGFVANFTADTGGAPFGLGGFGVAIDTLALSVDSTRTGPPAELVLDGSVSIPGLGTIAVDGAIRSDTTGSLAVSTDSLSIGGDQSSLVVSGTLALARAWTPGPSGRPVLVTTFGGQNVDLKWTPFNTFNNSLHFNIPNFSVASSGQIDVAVDGLTFLLGGTSGTRMALTTGPMTLDVNPAQGRFELQIGGAQLEVPGLFPGSNKLNLLPFVLSTAPTFSTARNIDFSLGPFHLNGGRLTFRRTAAGVLELAAGPRSALTHFQFVLPGLANVNLGNFSIDTLGRFDLNVAAPQIGPAALHIENASLVVDKNTSNFSVSLTGGKLDLPIGPTIDLPSFAFSTTTGDMLSKSLWLAPSALNFGDFFKRAAAATSKQFELSATGGVLRLTQTSSAFAMQALPGSSVSMSNLVIASDGTFSGTVAGTLGIGDFQIASATYNFSLTGGVVRAALAQPASVNLGFATVNVTGYFESDGDYSFTGTSSNFNVPGFGLMSVSATFENGAFTGTVRQNNNTIGSISQTGSVSLFSGGPSFLFPSGLPSGPEFSISDASVTEGNSGTKDLVFDLTMANPPAFGTISVKVQLQEDTSVEASRRATLGSDVSTSYIDGYTFSSSIHSRQVKIQVFGDTWPEADERLKVAITYVSSGIIADGVGIGTIVNDDPVPQTMTATINTNFYAFNGYIDGGSVFFDANGNGIPDFLDLNGNGIQDEGEPDEPTATTAADGSFQLPIPLAFDRDGDGQLSADEGTLVVTGGIDTGTLLPNQTPLLAPGGSLVVTPLTTLATRMIQSHGLTAPDAAEAIRESLGLSPEIDLFGYNAIAGAIGGDPLAPAIMASIIQVNDTAISIGRLLAGAGAAPLDTATLAAYDALAAALLAAGSSPPFADSPAVASLIDSAAAIVGVSVDPLVAQAAAQVIAESNQRIAGALPVASFDYLAQLKAIQAVALGSTALDMEEAQCGFDHSTGVGRSPHRQRPRPANRASRDRNHCSAASLDHRCGPPLASPPGYGQPRV
jgi:hypothetical protein